jgi:hypothetical protein
MTDVIEAMVIAFMESEDGQKQAGGFDYRVSLRAALSAALERGWVLVPKEPTLEMLHAADDCDGGAYDQSANGSAHWRAMLEKAPKP